MPPKRPTKRPAKRPAKRPRKRPRKRATKRPRKRASSRERVRPVLNTLTAKSRRVLHQAAGGRTSDFKELSKKEQTHRMLNNKKTRNLILGLGIGTAGLVGAGVAYHYLNPLKETKVQVLYDGVIPWKQVCRDTGYDLKTNAKSFNVIDALRGPSLIIIDESSKDWTLQALKYLQQRISQLPKHMIINNFNIMPNDLKEFLSTKPEYKNLKIGVYSEGLGANPNNPKYKKFVECVRTEHSKGNTVIDHGKWQGEGVFDKTDDVYIAWFDPDREGLRGGLRDDGFFQLSISGKLLLSNRPKEYRGYALFYSCE